MSWFYNSKGHLQGPLADKEIIKLIEAKELGADDLIFEAGSRHWTPVSEVPAFSKYVATKENQKKPAVESSWVVLKRDVASKTMKQLGPYSTEILQDMLRSKKLSLSDYIWKAGMKQWYRVISFPELVEALENTNTKSSPKFKLNEENTDELLQNVVKMKMLPPQRNEDFEDTVADDLKDYSEITDTEVIPKQPEKATKATSSSKDKHSKLRKMEAMGRKPSRWALWISMSLAFVGLLIIAFLMRNRLFELKNSLLASRQFPSTEAARVPVAQPPAPKEPVTAKPAESKSLSQSLADKAPEPIPTKAPVPTPTPEPIKEASYVRLNYKAKNSVLEVKTDASSKFKAQLKFTSLLGQVIGANSYYREIFRSDREIDLKRLGWPEGFYSVEAQIGQYKASEKLYIGRDMKAYAEKLRAHKKRLSREFMDEKVQFIKDSEALTRSHRNLVKILSAAGKSMNKKLSEWQKSHAKVGSKTLRNIGPKSRNAYILADLWLQLKDQRNSLRSLAAQIRSKGDSMIAESRAILQKQQAELSELSAQGQKLSLWQ